MSALCAFVNYSDIYLRIGEHLINSYQMNIIWSSNCSNVVKMYKMFSTYFKYKVKTDHHEPFEREIINAMKKETSDDSIDRMKGFLNPEHETNWTIVSKLPFQMYHDSDFSSNRTRPSVFDDSLKEMYFWKGVGTMLGLSKDTLETLKDADVSEGMKLESCICNWLFFDSTDSSKKGTGIVLDVLTEFKSRMDKLPSI